MIRRLLARLMPGRRANAPRVYGPDEHPVRRDQLSAAARSVTRRLQDAGFKAFVVGGAVRDLLLGIEPKDFDIATDATPEQVKPLFRRAFIIGRRFRLVHVHVGNETIEVSTFRAAQTGDDATDEHGRLLSDNVYGSQAEDAARRDFTINALYFDPATEEDLGLRRRRRRHPCAAAQADRTARHALPRGSGADAARRAPCREARPRDRSEDRRSRSPELAPLMQNVPPARLFDEMQKLLLSGHAVETLRSLRAHGLSHGLLPLLDVILEQPLGPALHRPRAGRHRCARARRQGVSPGVPVRDAAVARGAGDVERGQGARASGRMPALFEAMDKVLHAQAERIAIPRRFEATIKEIWSLQPRFEQRSGNVRSGCIEHPRFRAAYDFLVLPAARAARCRRPSSTGGRTSRKHRTTPAKRMLKPDEAPKKRRALAQPQASRPTTAKLPAPAADE